VSAETQLKVHHPTCVLSAVLRKKNSLNQLKHAKQISFFLFQRFPFEPKVHQKTVCRHKC
jgi:hypothetical protein